MDLSKPIRSVIPSAQADVLSVLARSTEMLSGRRVADLTKGGVDQKHVSQILNALADAGIATKQVHGSSHLYRLNTRHLAADAIVQLATMRERLVALLTSEVDSWDVPAVGSWLFGSAARGTGTDASDIDLLVIRDDSVDVEDPAWRRQLEELQQNVSDWTGNDCQILEYGSRAFRDLIDAGDPITDSIRADGVRLAGSRATLMKSAAKSR
jgi:DNA-binding transcriptional ArsR family regulator